MMKRTGNTGRGAGGRVKEPSLVFMVAAESCGKSKMLTDVIMVAFVGATVETRKAGSGLQENGQTSTSGGAELKGKTTAMIVCWLLGNGHLFVWNNMLTAEDYYLIVPGTHCFLTSLQLLWRYHPTRVFTVVYVVITLATSSIMAHYEATINTRKRNLIGYFLFFISAISIPILDLATSGNGSLATYISLCSIVVIFGLGDGCVEGGMLGDLSLMCPEFIQPYLAGSSASGVLTSALRIIIKAVFKNSKNGLRMGPMMFLVISALFELLFLLLYAFVFVKIPVVKYYHAKAALEGSKTVMADLAYAPVQQNETAEEGPNDKLERLSHKQLLLENKDHAIIAFLISLLTYSIFPGFLAEDTGKHGLGTCRKLKVRVEKRPMIATVSRFALVPAFYFTAKYGDQGWMIFLTSLLGLTNGYLSVCFLNVAPQGYKGPEQNALGNLLTICVLGGLVMGIALDWLWLIGKGW
ncbi:hypothetical protein C5167_042494 [Papaver somniferum]|uniref:Uncharacterized protein n=1 Tax=Papaver somniferum TaxID=3469 RepID=A0A4Y7L4P9_PAPSO|nr:hypothetical protein C5167_042494 [Papaver somniferum]